MKYLLIVILLINISFIKSDITTCCFTVLNASETQCANDTITFTSYINTTDLSFNLDANINETINCTQFLFDAVHVNWDTVYSSETVALIQRISDTYSNANMYIVKKLGHMVKNDSNLEITTNIIGLDYLKPEVSFTRSDFSWLDAVGNETRYSFFKLYNTDILIHDIDMYSIGTLIVHALENSTYTLNKVSVKGLNVLRMSDGTLELTDVNTRSNTRMWVHNSTVLFHGYVGSGRHLIMDITYGKVVSDAHHMSVNGLGIKNSTNIVFDGLRTGIMLARVTGGSLILKNFQTSVDSDFQFTQKDGTLEWSNSTINSNSRIRTVDSNVTVSNVIFQDNRLLNFILYRSDTLITNCTFHNITTIDKAFELSEGFVTVKECKFTSIHVRSLFYAIYQSGFLIESSYFADNAFQRNMLTVVREDSELSKEILIEYVVQDFLITGSIFERNYAGEGLIRLYDNLVNKTISHLWTENSKLEITCTTFRQNLGALKGAVITALGLHQIHLNNVRFVKNNIIEGNLGDWNEETPYGSGSAVWYGDVPLSEVRKRLSYTNTCFGCDDVSSTDGWLVRAGGCNDCEDWMNNAACANKQCTPRQQEIFGGEAFNTDLCGTCDGSNRMCCSNAGVLVDGACKCESGKISASPFEYQFGSCGDSCQYQIDSCGDCNGDESGCSNIRLSCEYNVVNELDKSTKCEVSVNRAPSGNVRMSLTTDGDMEIVGGIGDFLFTPLVLSHKVVLKGLRNENVFSNQIVCWKLTSSGSDFNFVLNCAKKFLVKNIIFPRIQNISSTNMPLIGNYPMVVDGQFLLSNRMRVFVGTGERRKEAVITGKYSGDSTKLEILSPEFLEDYWPETYQQLYFEVDDGGFRYCGIYDGELGEERDFNCDERSHIYITSSCVYEGYWGHGKTCKPCPTGGFCPGGNRIWPLPGYWNGDEFTPNVYACSEPSKERCIGGRYSVCGNGYTAEYCAECKTPEYYSEGFYCQPCQANEDDEYIVLIVLLSIIYFGFIAATIIFSTDRALDYVVMTVVSIQQLVAIGSTVLPHLPKGWRDNYRYIRFLMFDLNFIRPGCTIGIIQFPLLYIGTVLFILLAIFLFTLSGVAHQFKRRKQSLHWFRNPRKPRVMRSFIVVFHITYLQMSVRTLQMMNCINTGSDESRLKVELSLLCYQGVHTGPYALAWIIMLSYLIGIPAFLFWRLYKGKQRGEKICGKSKSTFRYRYGFLFRKLRSKYWWFGMLIYIINFGIALQTTVFVDSLTFLLLMCIAFFAIKIFLVVYFLPYLRQVSNLYTLGIGSIKVIGGSLLLIIAGEVATGITLLCLGFIFSAFTLGFRKKITGRKRFFVDKDGIELEKVGGKDDDSEYNKEMDFYDDSSDEEVDYQQELAKMKNVDPFETHKNKVTMEESKSGAKSEVEESASLVKTEESASLVKTEESASVVKVEESASEVKSEVKVEDEHKDGELGYLEDE